MDVTPQELFAVIGEQQVKIRLAQAEIKIWTKRVKELEDEKASNEQQGKEKE